MSGLGHRGERAATSIADFKPTLAESRSMVTIISRNPSSSSVDFSFHFPVRACGRPLVDANRSYDRQRGINATACEGKHTNCKVVVQASDMRPHQGKDLGNKNQNRRDHASSSTEFGMPGACRRPSGGPTRGIDDYRDVGNADNSSRSSVGNILARSLENAVAVVRGKNSPAIEKTKCLREDNMSGVAALMYPICADPGAAHQRQGQQQSRYASLAKTSSVPGTLNTPGEATPSIRDEVNGSGDTAGTEGNLVRAESGTLRGSEAATPPDAAHGVTVPNASCIPVENNSNQALAQSPPVPRVATLASSRQRIREGGDDGGYDDRKNSKQQPQQPFLVKTKDFDPDKLECVLRHQASLVERAKEIESSREATRRRSLFRARPLPGFLGSDGGESGVKTDKHGEGASGKRCGGLGGEGKPGLLEALEQVCVLDA